MVLRARKQQQGAQCKVGGSDSLMLLLLILLLIPNNYVGQVMLTYLKCLSFLEAVSDYLTVDNGC